MNEFQSRLGWVDWMKFKFDGLFLIETGNNQPPPIGSKIAVSNLILDLSLLVQSLTMTVTCLNSALLTFQALGAMKPSGGVAPSRASRRILVPDMKSKSS